MRNEITTRSNSPFQYTFFWLIADLTLLLVFWLVIGIYGPRQKQVFDSYGLQLPQLTRTAIEISLFLQDFWWLCVPLSVILVAGGIVLSRHGPFSVKIGNFVSTLILFLLTLATGFIAISLNLAQMKLAGALVK